MQILHYELEESEKQKLWTLEDILVKKHTTLYEVL
jgi:hypothetical protein